MNLRVCFRGVKDRGRGFFLLGVFEFVIYFGVWGYYETAVSVFLVFGACSRLLCVLCWRRAGIFGFEVCCEV